LAGAAAVSVPNWAAYLGDPDADSPADQFHRHARTDRPLGSNTFVADVEARLGRVLRPMKPGPKSGRGDTRTCDLFSDLGGE